jgi:1,4-dihydroxy-2-naphthoate octaprenyltransferase
MSNRKHTFGEWMIAVRPWSFPASAMPVITATAYLFWKGAEIDWLFALWALVNIVIFHAAGNTWSDYFDFRKKVDADDTFGAKTLTTGMFTEKEIFRLSLVLTIIAAAGGVGLLLMTGLPLLWIGLAGVACTLLYPMLKFNALGDLDILLTFAFLPTLGTSYAATGAIDWNVLLIALPVGLITDGILHSNNTRDMLTDKRAGIRTMAMSLGNNVSAWLYGFEVIFPFIWIGVCSITGLMPLTTLAIFLTLPIAIACAQSMKFSLTGGAGVIADLDVRTANLQLLFSLLLTAAFIVGKFIA